MNLSELYKNNQKLNNLRQKLHDAYKSNDENAVTDTFLQMFQTVGDINREEYQQQLDGMKQELDNSVLYARGVRRPTTSASTIRLWRRPCAPITPSRRWRT